MRVTSLVVYPVKSTRGLARESAAVAPWGLVDDRRWAVVDEQGRKVTARKHPRLLHVTATPRAGGLTLTAADLPELTVDTPHGGPLTPVDFRNLEQATLADDSAGDWLSRLLDTKVRLVWLDDPERRAVAEKHGARDGEVVSLADAGPLLLTSTSSLRQLDEWVAATATELGEPRPAPLRMARFRPNVVVDSPEPFAEDGWHRVRVGDVEFRVLHTCDRCVMTTIEPDTLARGKEPIRTLAKHRKWDGHVWFGVWLVPQHRGVIRVDDPVTPG